MNVDKLVSIVLTTLNCAQYLREAIDSCLQQSWSSIELIIVDGGSTDGTLEILAGYCDPRIQIIHQPGNEGKLPGAINLGLASAKGEYLTWMQGDSIYQRHAIERMVRCLDSHPDVGHVYTDYWVIDENGHIQATRQTCEPGEILKAKGDSCGVCFMVRQSVHDTIGPHDVDAYPTQDYDYRLRIAMRFQSFHVNEPLYFWRIHPNSLTGSRPWIIDARNDVRIRRKLGLSTPQQAKRELAEIDIAYAFECYQNGNHSAVSALVWKGIRRDSHYALNRGVWSILLRSVFHPFSFASPRGRHV